MSALFLLCLDQIIRNDNRSLDKTLIYCYDNIGNITSVKTYAYTTADTPSGTYTTDSYTYDKDRLTQYGYNNISYNSIGYPVSYGDREFVWTKGKLTRLYDNIGINSTSSSEDVRFTYNAYGQRTSKVYTYDPGENSSGDYKTGSATTYYYDNSGRLIREYITEFYYESNNQTYELIYLYDESGIIGVMYSRNGVPLQPYYYDRNHRGDVIAIYDTNGNKKAGYVYDAFGNCRIIHSDSSTQIAFINPIRYRGYYYDTETKLYYLNARYYNPEWRRFISPDDTAYLDPESINGLNLYCYCGNDPINYCDPSGHSFILATAILGAALGFGIAAYSDYKSDGKWFNGNIGNYIGYTLGGAVIGGLIGAGVSGLLTGSFFSSVIEVYSGAVLTYNMGKAGGTVASLLMMGDNFVNSIYYKTHVFWSGGKAIEDLSSSIATSLNGITIQMTKLGQYLNSINASDQLWELASKNFASQVPFGSVIYAIQSIEGLKISCMWGNVEYPIVKEMVEKIIYIILGVK